MGDKGNNGIRHRPSFDRTKHQYSGNGLVSLLSEGRRTASTREGPKKVKPQHFKEGIFGGKGGGISRKVHKPSSRAGKGIPGATT